VTGIRVGEAIALNRDDIDHDAGGEPPRIRIPDPIRSGPERRMIYARTA
jgi:integrase